MRQVIYKAIFPDPTRAMAAISSAMRAQGVECNSKAEGNTLSEQAIFTKRSTDIAQLRAHLCDTFGKSGRKETLTPRRNDQAEPLFRAF